MSRILTFAAVCAGLLIAVNAYAEPVKIIYDTDMMGDVDDVGALALLNKLADAGEAEILAVMVSVTDPWTAPCADAINTWYGRPDIPIGQLKGEGVGDGSSYTKAVAEQHPHDLKSGDDAPDVVALYRKILAAQPDRSVTIVTVGFLTNLRNLLDSKPDTFSGLNGVDLIEAKVKQWVCMGCRFPEGWEYNIHKDAKASIETIQKWPVPAVFSGFEIGMKIMTGAALRSAPKEDPVRTAYQYYNGLNDRESWDHTAVLFAVRGAGEYWDVHRGGGVVVREDGFNQWDDSLDSQYAYLVQKMSPDDLADVIEEQMVLPPR
ncbi:MAG: nucleoside hydrolase [bacterium]|nr:nucleoside hydrolase [bacterium]